MDGIDDSVGLNYTGGTKPMALHAYRAIVERKIPETVFSYLDARKLRLFIEARKGNPPQSFHAGTTVSLGLEHLFALHGYSVDVPQPKLKASGLCRSLAHVHSTSEGRKEWQQYLATSPSDLPTVQTYPHLELVIQAFTQMCTGANPTPERIAQILGYKSFASCSKFLYGEWLEEHTLDAVMQIVPSLSIQHYGMGLKPYKPGMPGKNEFELDVAVMYGYQLFAISCMATEVKGKAKEHLFEVYVRARQLGGDEARFALLCCMDTPKDLQDEIEYQWDAAGKIRVFGAEHLPQLAGYLKDWFVKANKG